MTTWSRTDRGTAYFDFVKHEILIPVTSATRCSEGPDPTASAHAEGMDLYTDTSGIPQGPDASRRSSATSTWSQSTDVMDDYPGVKYFRYLDDIRIVGPSRSAVIGALSSDLT